MDSDDLSTVATLAGAGELRVRIGRTFPLHQAAQAHRVVTAGHTGGKVVLTAE
jgi:NADPH:quinone reductase-like Zn-dependent oxidoreductase